MSAPRAKVGCFILEALNSFSTTYYFFYLFFFMAREHGFGNRDNLWLGALNGFVYMSCVWFGGRFGQRYGYYTALALGFSIMAASLITGAFVHSVSAHIAVMAVCTVGMSFTWPTLEAMVSEGETPIGLQRTIGIYNIIWAGVGGSAFFCGGFLLEQLGLRSLFWVPAGIQLLQLNVLLWLKRRSGQLLLSWPRPAVASPALPPLNPRPIARAKLFLKLAWLANPFAYIAINTVAAVIPGIAERLNFTPMLAGFFCSVWFFGRFGMFVWLSRWNGWHYRFRWFIGAYVLLVAGFATILLAPKLLVIVFAQIGFGMGLGLLYYSSLFYSMDLGEAKAEHGGVHEAAIGAGIFAGPAIGATALYLFPGRPSAGTIAVSGVLVLGLVALLCARYRNRASF